MLETSTSLVVVPGTTTTSFCGLHTQALRSMLLSAGSQKSDARSSELERWDWGHMALIPGRKAAALVLVLAPVAVLNACNGCNTPPPVAVTTYHYDNLRTGWNASEDELNYANVNPSSFGLLPLPVNPVNLDDQVDTQPLIVPNETINGGAAPGKHDVVYVATEGNTIYAIDASSGAVLLHPNFGPPVRKPLGCDSNGPNVGIDGTPVIDLATNTMYVIIYTQDSGGPIYRIHELDLSSLADRITPVVVAASHTLTNGTTFNFNATYQRQRPALVEANGNIYAGFGSFCDARPDLSRGWLLGWQAGSLAPLAANQLNDRQATAPGSFFLSSVWMSGYGISADQSGNLYFVTGNSNTPPTQNINYPNTYDGVTNIQESVVKVSPDLTKVMDLFTPSDVNILDHTDWDFGSGGVLLLPLQNAPLPRLAIAAGKDGWMFLLDRDNLGGLSPNPSSSNIGPAYQIDPCWCGQSYFFENVVSSGGRRVRVWQLHTSPSVTLKNVASSEPIGGLQDDGFFTSVSSAGITNVIIWAVSRPHTKQSDSGACVGDATVNLYAFNAGGAGGGTLPQLYKGAAGTWQTCTANANIVPVVANSKVYIASYQQLAIFGLK